MLQRTDFLSFWQRTFLDGVNYPDDVKVGLDNDCVFSMDSNEGLAVMLIIFFEGSC